MNSKQLTTAFRPSPICPFCGHPGPGDQQQASQILSCVRCHLDYESRRNILVDFTTIQPGSAEQLPVRRCANCQSTLQVIDWMLNDLAHKAPEQLPGLLIKYHQLLAPEKDRFRYLRRPD